MQDNVVSNFLHGGDYNPEQWLENPEILAKDIELMKKAQVNTVTLGVFSWAKLEPQEGKFQFSWLDNIIKNISKEGIKFILATPSGARPSWLAKKYPEVLRTNENREKLLFGERHNHCFTSPIYRKKVQTINLELAKRYAKHPGLLMWHVGNEYSGDCHCELCQKEFREWLRKKYGTLDELNRCWWSSFWSHTYCSWDEIESPSPIGMKTFHALNLDWKRFTTDQTIDFFKNEIKPLMEVNPNVPITTNFFAGKEKNEEIVPLPSLDYSKFSKVVDTVSWDSYPTWHNDKETLADTACRTGFMHDQFYSFKNKPFFIMECSPSNVVHYKVNRSKKPGMHLLSSIQSIAHGANSILYFQWRKSRGAAEKFHGAVIDHDNRTDNRVFQEVVKVGKALNRLTPIINAKKSSKVALIFDWDTSWSLSDLRGFSKENLNYNETSFKHYKQFWENDVSIDVISLENDLSKYKLIIAPMLFMISSNDAKRLKNYVNEGGILVSTYLTGIVDQNDLAYLNGWNEDLKTIFGLSIKETDTLYPNQKNAVLFDEKLYELEKFCTRLDLNSAKILGKYQEDFYKGEPCITKNILGKGSAYFLGARSEDGLLQEFYKNLIHKFKLNNTVIRESNPVVSVQTRETNKKKYIFIMNFSEENQVIIMKEPCKDVLSEENTIEKVSLGPLETKVMEVEKNKDINKVYI
jgi:beta-galactosidase